MKSKSNKDLETILEEKEKYNEEAIQAVIWELENRGLLDKVEIETEEIIQETTKNEEITENDKNPFEELELSLLYSKKTIQGFSILFSTIFGAFLLMSNLKAMNKPKAKVEVLVFAIVYTTATFVLLNYLPKVFFITLIFNIIGYIILAEYFWNKHLGKDLSYRKKQIWKPLTISILILVSLLFLQFLPKMMGV